MSTYSDTVKLPAAQARAVLRAARLAREAARAEIAAGFRAERQAQALAEAEAARDAIQARGGIGTLTAEEYRHAKAAMQSRLRRAR